jgi:hypothetical protein
VASREADVLCATFNPLVLQQGGEWSGGGGRGLFRVSRSGAMFSLRYASPRPISKRELLNCLFRHELERTEVPLHTTAS